MQLLGAGLGPTCWQPAEAYLNEVVNALRRHSWAADNMASLTSRHLTATHRAQQGLPPTRFISCAGPFAAWLQDGVCSKACYPPGAKREGGDWSSRDPVCASGITYMNRAEAMVS